MPAKPMTKAQVLDHLAKKVNLPKKTAAAFVDEFVKLAYAQAKNSFTIPGLGKLVLMKRKARTGRNPATGQTIKIPAKTVVKFRIAKACKDAILPKK